MDDTSGCERKLGNHGQRHHLMGHFGMTIERALCIAILVILVVYLATKLL